VPASQGLADGSCPLSAAISQSGAGLESAVQGALESGLVPRRALDGQPAELRTAAINAYTTRWPRSPKATRWHFPYRSGSSRPALTTT